MARRKHGRQIAKAIAAAPPPASVSAAAALLGRAAAALAALEASGLTVQLAHGAVITDAGYVLRIGGTWVPRARTLTEFPVVPGDD